MAWLTTASVLMCKVVLELLLPSILARWEEAGSHELCTMMWLWLTMVTRADTSVLCSRALPSQHQELPPMLGTAVLGIKVWLKKLRIMTDLCIFSQNKGSRQTQKPTHWCQMFVRCQPEPHRFVKLFHFCWTVTILETDAIWFLELSNLLLPSLPYQPLVTACQERYLSITWHS